MRKRFLSVLLTLCMVLTMLPLASFAADGETPAADTSGLEVTEVGAFASAENFLSYVNGTYYLNEGSGIPTDDVSPNTMFVRLSEAVPESYKLYILVRSADDQNAVGSWYIESPKSFAYFTDAALTAGTTYTVRLGIYTEFSSANAADDIFWEKNDKTWAKGSTNVVTHQVTVSNTAKTAAPGTITLTENGLAADAKSTITWTNADNDSSKITAKIGAPVSFTVTAPQKYAVKSVTVGGEAAEPAEEEYSFVMNGATEAVVVTYESTEIAEVQLALDTSDIAAGTAVADLPSATISSITLTGASSAITDSTEIAKYVSAVTAWTDSSDNQLSGNLAAGQIKYKITVTVKSSSEAAYALAANAVKVTNVADATVSGNVASGTFTVPAAAEKYTIKFAPGEGASGSMDEVKVAKAGSGAATYTTPTTHTFTEPTGKTFDKWTVNEITGVTISEDGKTLTIGENVAVSEVITLTATWKTTAVAPAAEPEFTLVPGSFEFVGKQVSALQSGVSIAKDANTANTWVITTPEEGKISYISGWTGFNTALTSEQNGYYIAYSVPKTIGTSGNEQTITGMILTGHDANGDPVEKKYEDEAALNGVFTDNGNTACYIISHIGSDDSAKNASLTIKLKYGSAAEYTQYTIKCSNVNLEEKATIVEIEATADSDGTLSVTAEQTDLNNAINAAKAENKGVFDDAAKTPVTIKVGVPSGTDEADVAGGTVTIPAGVLDTLKTDGASNPDMPLAVDVPNVGSITLPVESVEKLATENKEITVEVATNPDAAAPSDTTLATAGITDAGNYESSAFKAEVKVGGTVVGSTDTAWGTESGAFITLVFNIGVNANWNTNNIKVIHRSGSSEEVIKSSDMRYDATTGLLTVRVKHLSDTIIYTPKATSSSSITITCTRDATSIGPKVTVTGLTNNNPVTVQVAKAANTAPAVVFTMTADGNGEVEFNATAGSVVTVWDGQVTFDNGIPNNSPALEYAQETVTNP